MYCRLFAFSSVQRSFNDNAAHQKVHSLISIFRVVSAAALSQCPPVVFCIFVVHLQQIFYIVMHHIGIICCLHVHFDGLHNKSKCVWRCSASGGDNVRNKGQTWHKEPKGQCQEGGLGSSGWRVSCRRAGFKSCVNQGQSDLVAKLWLLVEKAAWNLDYILFLSQNLLEMTHKILSR